MLHILYNTKAPSYLTLVSMLRREIHLLSLALPPTTLALDDLKLAYRQHFSTLVIRPPRKQDTVLLGTTDPGKRFKKKYKGKCSRCGKQGHKSVDCYQDPKNAHKNPRAAATAAAAITNPPSAVRPPLFCTYCKGTNHTIDRCFKKRDDDKAKSSATAAPAVTAMVLICIENIQFYTAPSADVAFTTTSRQRITATTFSDHCHCG
jgi:hypothetical protein